jgi:biopolymer transport protein ExbD
MPLKTSNEELPAINLTSMIDVLFLLIIFFMVGTRFSESEQQLDMRLPNASAPATMLDRPTSRVVCIYADGTLEFDGQRITLQQLTANLGPAVRNYPELSVQLKMDTNSTAGQQTPVIEAIKRAGVKNFGWTVVASRMPGATVR